MGINVTDYNEIKDQVLTIDVRTVLEVKTLAKLDWAINYEMNYLHSNYEEILKNHENKKIITVCNAGNRSSQAAQFLREKGYDADYLDGGIYRYMKIFKK